MCAASFRIDPLNAENYNSWKLQMRAILIKNDLWCYVDGSVICPEVPAEKTKWKTFDEKACADLTLSITPSELGLISDCVTAKEIWDKLKSTFASSGPAKKATLIKRIALSQLKEGECVREYLNEYFDAVKRLRDIDFEIKDDLLSVLLLYSLPSSFENFRCALETRDELPKPDVLRVKILEEYESRKANEIRSEQQHALYTKNARENVSAKRKNFNCFRCGKPGHFAKRCKAKINGKQHQPNQSEKRDTVLYSSETALLGTLTDRWCLDSGCTSHMCKNVEMFKSIKYEKKTLHLADQNTTAVDGVGTIKIVNGDGSTITLHDVLYVKNLRTNLLSVSKITEKGLEVRFKNNTAVIYDPSKKIDVYVAERIGSLYYLEEWEFAANTTELPRSADKSSCNAVDLLHLKIGHLNEQDLKLLINNKLVHGVKINKMQNLTTCKVCITEKQSQLTFPKINHRTNELLEIVHADVCGPIRVNSPSGSRYFVTFIDDKSIWCEVFFLKHRNEVFSSFLKYKAAAELLTGKRIKALQSDNGKEFYNKEFNKFLDEHGIKRRLSAPYTPQQNGIAERKNRTLVEMARCMLKQFNAPPCFWAEAINTACYIRNRCPTRSLGKEIPYKIWLNKTPTVAHMQVFGCKAFVLNKSMKGKFDSRSKRCVFVGYASNAKAFRLWCPKTRNIIISRDVRFVSELFFSPENHNDAEVSNTNEYLIEYHPISNTVENPTSENTPTRMQLDDVTDNTRGRGRPRLLRDGRPGRPKKHYSKVQKPLSNETLENVESEVNSSEEESYESANFVSIEDPTNLFDALNSDYATEWLKALHS